ncbi:hypothetical protein BACCIP111899_03886 [Bacillus rhizoplanae]|uniref:Uncharacterized protein n=1 Tax=Bacillus rhizoplanae TaxID=2880966 RepID=A0ABM8YFM6_9BACI|nr:hypothetical protein [Bacillus rhizoplanae]CAG9614653.1 hypothetical protein BACCIP111899_03886 [Bacillus rhizoplanae]
MEQLTIFDVIDETKTRLYETLKAKGLHYTIQGYYLHNDYKGMVKYFYIRTTDNTIIDLCISEFPEVFAIHEGFSDIAIKKIFKGRL